MDRSTKFAPFTKLAAVALTAVLAVGLGACDGDVSSADSGSLSLQLTDAPAGDLDSAWVDIGTIALQGEGEDEEGEVVLVENPEGPRDGFFELTSLAGTTADLVSDVSVPAGSYGQLRIVIEAAALRTDDGDVFSFNGAADALGLTRTGRLQAPSIPQTGIKVNLDGFTLESEAKILVLDFDVSESFGREAGQSNMWVMRPTITSSELEASGSIGGTVGTAEGVSVPECGGDARDVSAFVPVVLDPASGDTLKSGDVDGDGSYAIDFLEPADYDLGHAPEVTFDGEKLVFEADVSPQQVTVDTGSEETADYTITSAACEQTGS